MSEASYDIVILGAGSGGYAAALRASQLGLKVALIEGDKVGGTCLHRGCIPTKAYLHVAETADAIRDAAPIGINATLNSIDMVQVGTYRDGIVNKLYRGVEGLLSSRKVETIHGWGRVVSPDSVEVNGQIIKGKNLILATGSYSKTLPTLPIEGRVITSEQALKMDWIPQRALILGGGVIGCEFASAWRSFGSEVTILEGLPHLVPNEDEVISKNLERAFRKRGIKFQLGTRFAGATQDETGVHATTEDGKTFDGDILLVAVGRGPVTQDLGYEQIGVEMERGFVLADELCRTNVPGVYAVGDIVPGLQLAHRGFAQGIMVAEQIAGLNPDPLDENTIPRVTFTEPEIASVGLTEDQAKERYGAENLKVVDYNLAGNGKSNILGAAGLIKLVGLKDGPILGFHAIGARVSEQIGEGELIVGWEAYPEDVARFIHAHPTQNEAIGEAAMALAGKPLHAHD